MLSRLSGIYQIKNLINGKIYVGSAADFYERWHSHQHYLNINNHHNQHLQRAWNKYGKQYFIFEILEIIHDTSVIVAKEQSWINFTQCCNSEIGYNIRVTANSNLGLNFSKEHKAKMSIAQTGRIITLNQRAKISEKLKGRIINDEVRLRMGAAHRKLDKWPCLDAWKCKCVNCKKKRSEYMKERRRNN